MRSCRRFYKDSIMKTIIFHLALTLILSSLETNGFIIPNEIPTVLSLIYSNIPPLKIGQDTRFGIGFRLGPHADFQTLIELGPQTNTNPIGPDQSSPSKRDFLRSPFQQAIDTQQQKLLRNKPVNDVAVSLPEPKVAGLTEVNEQQASTAQPDGKKPTDEKKRNRSRKDSNAFVMEKIVFEKVPGIDT